MVKVYAPASIGNVSVGFDVLGAAISPIDNQQLGDCVSVVKADKFNLKNSGFLLLNCPSCHSKISFTRPGNCFVKNWANLSMLK